MLSYWDVGNVSSIVVIRLFGGILLYYVALHQNHKYLVYQTALTKLRYLPTNHALFVDIFLGKEIRCLYFCFWSGWTLFWSIDLDSKTNEYNSLQLQLNSKIMVIHKCDADNIDVNAMKQLIFLFSLYSCCHR